MKTKLYFAYGANMCVDSMSYRCPRAIPMCGFTLNDWELKFYSHATIEPKAGAKVVGVLWSITEDCEQHLDTFEGFPHYYTKLDWKQGTDEFFFYEMTSPKSGYPSNGYIDSIEAAYKKWDLPCEMLYQALDYEQSYNN